MLDTSPLTAVVERFAERLRAAPQSRLQRGAAAEALELARELSVRAQRLEDPQGAAEPRLMPEAGIFVVGDQLAVAGQDLAEALRDASRRPAGAAGAADAAGDSAKAPSEMLDEAVRLVEQAEVRAMR
ncbi:hypothetical protein MTF65_16600 [Streptomyces sp. APSN-46.1]|uniref:hypothetical protein n=1 Tax=Streptomyces sp. APSN-46.1 TaxID=2929049 RepID=UPI001FB4F790|nr:hypothetical protein [Streptomyces sp. APSN-46.1]MCJ1678927.1 hypothetical protein [Streptomyces sp. APSN-46.1]